MAVTVVVCPGGAGAEASRCYSSFFRDILKLAVAQIAIECIPAKPSYVNIGQTIVVDGGVTIT